MSHGHRLLLKWARLVHVYLTLFAFLVVLFFAATGFILNHPQWFGHDDKHETIIVDYVPTNLLDDPDKHDLAIVELLRTKFGARGTLETFDAKDPDLPIDIRFKAPGLETEAQIGRKDGHLKVTHYSRGLLGVLTDLHRGDASGNHTGDTWSLVIDSVAILLLVISLTGLTLWTSLRSRGNYGLAAMGLGLAICGVVYFLFVP